MKSSIISFIALSFAFLSSGQTKEPDAAMLKSHFSSVLSGSNTQFTSDIKFPISEISTIRTNVWTAWTEANNEFSEEKLAKLYPITDGMVKTWQLPAELEPNAKMPYLLGYKGKKTDIHPLIIFLHGSGPKDDEWNLCKSECTKFIDDGAAAYFVPQIPNGGVVDGVQYYRWWQKAKQWAWEKLIRQINLLENIDVNMLYFAGISEGAYGSQRLGSFYADYLAGIGPMAGGEPLVNAPVENMRNTFIHFRTGSLDTSFYRSQLTNALKDSLNILQEKYPDGYVHDIEILEGLGHTIPYNKTTPELIKHTRNPNPKHVSWEDYPMDGNWRKGFFNIQVTRRSIPAQCERVYYEMDIEGNNITMRVNGVHYQTTDIYDNQNQYSDDLVLNFNRHYATATSGEFKVYLNNDLVDLSKPVTLTVNGKKVFNGKLQPNLADMVNSTALFYDKERVYPTHIDVNLDNMTADGPTSGIDSLTADDADENAPIEYYNLQGIRIEKPTEKGIYIRRQGSKATKIAIH